MDLLIIRHAIAEDREQFARGGRPDDERPLTDEGKKKMLKGARGLREVVPKIDLLASSPLVRARETAGIVAKTYGGLEVVTTPALRPDQPPEAVASWLGKHSADLVALVGHDPALSILTGWLLSGVAGVERPLIVLKKGAACLVELPEGGAVPGVGTLRWALTPSQLRALAE